MDVIAFLSDSIFTSPMSKRVWQVWLGVLYCSASLLVMPSMNAIGANAKLYEILGPEFRLANQEAQRLHEKAEELFYRAEYVASFSALESALVIVEAERLSKRDSATILTTMAELHGVLGNRSEAVKKENQALQIAEKELGSEHPVTARVWRAIAASRVMDGDMTAAQDALDRFFAVVGKHYGTNHVAFAIGVNLAAIMRSTSHYAGWGWGHGVGAG